MPCTKKHRSVKSHVKEEENEILKRRKQSKNNMDIFERTELIAAAHQEAAVENFDYNSLRINGKKTGKKISIIGMK